MSPADAACGGASFRGLVPTLYDGNGGPLAAFTASRELLKRARPGAVQIHAWEPGRAAEGVYSILPDAKLVVGFGVDSIAREAAKARWTEAQAVRTFVELAGRAARVGAVAIVWNAEASWKTPPTSEQRKRLEGAIRAGLAAVAALPGAPLQWHTAYDHPSYHSTYPWTAWLGAGSPVLASLPQVYAAPEGGLMAARGALPAREARALSSWASAVRAGWIREDAPEGSASDLTDVDWLPYYQLHHVPRRETVAHALARPLSFGWALPTRSDAEGRAAFLVASALRRAGFVGEGAVARFQEAHGLAADGIVGDATTAAALRVLDALNAEGKGVAP